MKRASDLFDDAARREVSAAVASAEQRTSAEIVPVVATASGRYDRAEDLCGVAGGLTAVAAAWFLFQGVVPSDGAWEAGSAVAFGLLPVLGTFIAGFAVGVGLAHVVPELRHPFLRDREIDEEVARAADSLFCRAGVRRTRGGTGVLIYVSLFERRVRVVADEAVAAKIPDARWADVCERVLRGLRESRASQGLSEAIELSGTLLAEAFPPSDEAPNALPDELHVID